MIGERLVQLRLAQNLTLDALAEKMGGIVTKQALSKYELSQSQPSPSVLTKIAAALGVKADYFFSPSPISVEFVAFRKASSLPQREQTRVRSVVAQCLEDRIKIQTLIGQIGQGFLPWNQMPIESIEETEKHANDLRKLWDLGSSPISSVIGAFEEHQLCVLSIEADEKFDGISALGRDSEGKVLAGAIVTREGVPGERQRLNLTHELGHLVLKIPRHINGERAAFRFGSAFLVPADQLTKAVGNKRSYIHISELTALKKQYGISIQALLHRMHELEIINDSYYRRWSIFISKKGWKKQEPNELEPESPTWLNRNLSRLVAEGSLGVEDAERILGKRIDVEPPAQVRRRRVFLELPIEKRREIITKQMSQLVDYYENEAEFLESEDDISEY